MRKAYFMKINVKKDLPLRVKTDCLILGIFEGERLTGDLKTLDRDLSHVLSQAMNKKQFQGEWKETFFTRTIGQAQAGSILLVGLGEKKELTLDRLRQASGIATRTAGKNAVPRICTLLPGVRIKGMDQGLVVQAVTEGALLSLYEFKEHLSEEKKKTPGIRELTLLNASDTLHFSEGLKQARKICEGVTFARDLISQPGNIATPSFLAREAKKIASQSSLRCRILNRKDMEKLGMGALLGVARGSAEPPCFIILEHRGGNPGDNPVVLVGKGLTFDSGGISIKPSQGMEEMKTDMSGGAAVIAALKTVAALKLMINVVGLVPSTENMPGGRANKPGDVLKTLSGKTIEVINTDAEGRLILADALCYAERFKPSAVIDIATLTGACVVALGHHISGIMGTDQKLIEALKEAGDLTGERVWPLPLLEEFDEQIKSDTADMKNIGGRWGGAITAAALLKKFTSRYPWAHIDIAGTAWGDKDKPYIPKGAAGMGVRLFVQFLIDRGKKQKKGRTKSK